jgi:hypothetical protein
MEVSYGLIGFAAMLLSLQANSKLSPLFGATANL